MWGEENGKGKKEMGNLLGNPILLYNYKVPPDFVTQKTCIL